jgi:hypothetical protein
MVTREQLLNLREQALAKRQSYLDMIQQANGAVAMLDLLLSQLQSSEQQENENA